VCYPSLLSEMACLADEEDEDEVDVPEAVPIASNGAAAGTFQDPNYRNFYLGIMTIWDDCNLNCPSSPTLGSLRLRKSNVSESGFGHWQNLPKVPLVRRDCKKPEIWRVGGEGFYELLSTRQFSNFHSFEFLFT
jgi:hypothetical protein